MGVTLHFVLDEKDFATQKALLDYLYGGDEKQDMRITQTKAVVLACTLLVRLSDQLRALHESIEKVAENVDDLWQPLADIKDEVRR